jgi:hypothetical protein
MVDESQVWKKLTFCIIRIVETIYCSIRRDKIFALKFWRAVKVITQYTDTMSLPDSRYKVEQKLTPITFRPLGF